MKIIKTASGKQRIKMSKAEWIDLGKKANWIKEAVSYRELFHGTNTGVNNSNIDSFKKNGINSGISGGHGQGHGFYAWTGDAAAKNHALQLVSKERSFVSNAVTDGMPMVVKFVAGIHPSEWEIDFELNYAVIRKFIYDNFDYIKNLALEFNVIDAEEGINDTYKLRNKYDDDQKAFNLTKNNRGLKGFNLDDRSNEGDIGNARIFNAIIDGIKNSKGSELWNQFKAAFFDRMPSSDSKNAIALKYVGERPIKISEIYVYNNGQWTVA